MAGKTIIRNLILGEGLPKICIPVMGGQKEEVLASARAALACGPDILEWRADHLRDVQDGDAVREILRELRALAGETPVLFTFRTRQEGGEQELAAEAYERLCAGVLESALADALDVELFLPGQTAERLIRKAHACGVKTIASNHDFQKTPPKEEMVRRLCRMQELGADVAKIAVMPASLEDVLTLLAATEECARTLAVPVITMSMGALGAVSRLLGETFGSALTFGMAGQASAPGQIPADELREILKKLHPFVGFCRGNL